MTLCFLILPFALLKLYYHHCNIPWFEGVHTILVICILHIIIPTEGGVYSDPSIRIAYTIITAAIYHGLKACIPFLLYVFSTLLYMPKVEYIVTILVICILHIIIHAKGRVYSNQLEVKFILT